MTNQAPSTRAPSWTIRGVFGQLIHSFRTHWLVLIVALLLVPGLWSIPSNILWNGLKSPESLSPGSERYLLDRLFALSETAWNSLWEAGGLCIAIAVARSGQIRLRCLLTGLAYAPAMLLTFHIAFLPSEIMELLSPVLGKSLGKIFSGAAWWLSFYLLARTVFWAPLVVDGKIRVWDALLLSWGATRNLAVRIMGLILLLSCLSIPATVLDMAVANERLYFALGLQKMFRFVGVAVLYVTTWDEYLHSTPTDDACHTMPDCVNPKS